MQEVVLVIHLILALSIIGLVLIQRSEGGGLGIGGGGGGMGGLATPSGTASILTRTTAILALCFFITSLTLAVLARQSSESSRGILENTVITEEVAGDALDVPVSDNPAALLDADPVPPSVPLAE